MPFAVLFLGPSATCLSGDVTLAITQFLAYDPPLIPCKYYLIEAAVETARLRIRMRSSLGVSK